LKLLAVNAKLTPIAYVSALEYHDVEWLVTGVFIISSSVDWSNMPAKNLHKRPANGNQRSAALTNKKVRIDKIHVKSQADWVCIYRKEYTCRNLPVYFN
jgi:hypothetical protein